jgi:predicted TIM-barrel fold metal-dependent hydrolase
VDFVDVHPHAISKDTARYPLTPFGGEMAPWAKTRAVDGDELAAREAEAGIRRAVVVQAASAYSDDNSYVVDVAAAYPQRFLAVGIIDVRSADAADRLTYWVKERGMAGFRIYSSGEELDGWLADPQTFPAWERARDFGITINIQTGFQSFPFLSRVLERFAGVKVLLDHCGWPPVDDGPPFAAAQSFFDLVRHPNLYLKLTTSNFIDLRDAGQSRPFLEKLVAVFGAHRVAWGSNFPSSPGSVVEFRAWAERELAFLSEADRQAIFSDTALALYPRLTTV